jgi:hypothetical protein
MRIERLVLAVICAAWSPVALSAQSAIPQTQDYAAPLPGSSGEVDEEDAKAWKEIQAQLPPPPKPENLARVQTGSASGHQYFVDTSSISLGADGVTRFTVVTKTSGGATNVTFEGMRCETREQRLFAVGHKDGTWARAKDTQWKRVVLRELQPHYHTLYHDYFCANGPLPVKVPQVVNALKRGYGFRRNTASDG